MKAIFIIGGMALALIGSSVAYQKYYLGEYREIPIDTSIEEKVIDCDIPYPCMRYDPVLETNVLGVCYAQGTQKARVRVEYYEYYYTIEEEIKKGVRETILEKITSCK